MRLKGRRPSAFVRRRARRRQKILPAQSFKESHMSERKFSVKFFAPLFAAALCLALSAAASAQSTATVRGTVTDPQGAVVPNAKVVVHSNATGLERTAQTDSEGNYQVASLPPGVYRV